MGTTWESSGSNLLGSVRATLTWCKGHARPQLRTLCQVPSCPEAPAQWRLRPIPGLNAHPNPCLPAAGLRPPDRAPSTRPVTGGNADNASGHARKAQSAFGRDKASITARRWNYETGNLKQPINVRWALMDKVRDVEEQGWCEQRGGNPQKDPTRNTGDNTTAPAWAMPLLRSDGAEDGISEPGTTATVSSKMREPTCQRPENRILEHCGPPTNDGTWA